MAQNREKEETELKVPEALVCSTSIPSPPKLSGTEDPATAAARSQESSDPPASGTDRPRSRSARSPDKSDLAVPPPRPADAEVKRREVNRCSGCRRKVGLMGFRCRCGELFCSEHRYSDRHDCSFDYKAAGREAIARENPVVRAAKILKV